MVASDVGVNLRAGIVAFIMFNRVSSRVYLAASVGLLLVFAGTASGADNQKSVDDPKAAAGPRIQPPGEPYQKIVDHRVVKKSPDGNTRATIVYYKSYYYGEGESGVVIRDCHGRILGAEDWTCGGTQGFRVVQSQWSPDSRFFVFKLENAGGHSPSHIPVSFFDIQRRQFYAVGPLLVRQRIIDRRFRLTAPAKLTVLTDDLSSPVDKHLRTAIALNHLSPKDRNAAAREEEDFMQWLRKTENEWNPTKVVPGGLPCGFLITDGIPHMRDSAATMVRGILRPCFSRAFSSARHSWR